MRASFEAEKLVQMVSFFFLLFYFCSSVLELWAHGEIISRSINGWIL